MNIIFIFKRDDADYTLVVCASCYWKKYKNTHAENAMKIIPTDNSKNVLYFLLVVYFSANLNLYVKVNIFNS